MTVWMRGSLSAVGVAAIAVVLAACQSTGSNTANLNTIGAPAQLQPVQNSTVQQGTLPAIGATGTPAPGLSGQPVLGGVPANADGNGDTATATASARRLHRVARPAGPARCRRHERRSGRRVECGGGCRDLPHQPADDRQDRHQLLPCVGAGLHRAADRLGDRLAAGRQPAAAL